MDKAKEAFNTFMNNPQAVKWTGLVVGAVIGAVITGVMINKANDTVEFGLEVGGPEELTVSSAK